MMVDSQLILVKIKMYSRELAFFLFLLAVCKAVPNDHVDRVVVTKPTVSLLEGTQGLLSCHYSYPVYFVAWNKGSTLEETTNILIINMHFEKRTVDGSGYREGRFNITDDFSLVINNVKPDDEGRYYCEVADKETEIVYYSYTDVTVSEKPFMKIAHCPPYYPIMDAVHPGYDGCIFNLTAPEKEVHLNCSVVFPKQSGVDISLIWVKGNNGHVHNTATTYRCDDKNTCEMSVTMIEEIDDSQRDEKFSCIATGKVFFGQITGTAHVHRFMDVTLPTKTDKPINILTTTSLISYKVGIIILVLILSVGFMGFFVRLIIRKHRKTNANKEMVWPDDRESLIASNVLEHLSSGTKWTTNADGLLKIQHTNGEYNYTPTTVPKLFHKIVKQYPYNVAMAFKRNNKWEQIHFFECFTICNNFAKSLMEVGLRKYDRVGICGRYAPEWALAYLGTILAGGISVGLNEKYNMMDFWAVVDDCKPSFIIVETSKQTKMILDGLSSHSFIRAIVQYGETVETTNLPKDEVYSWEEFMKKGSNRLDDEVPSPTIYDTPPNSCCTITYTTRANNTFLGAMLSHDNITWNFKRVAKIIKVPEGTGQYINYINLCHIAIQMFTLLAPLFSGGAVYFADRDAVEKETLIQTMREVKPTFFGSAPVFWETVHEKINSKMSQASWVQQFLFSKAIKFYKVKSFGLLRTIVKKYIFRRVKALLGLDKCLFCCSSGSPLSDETFKFFSSIDIPICHAYGMRECAGLHFSCQPGEKIQPTENASIKTRYGGVGIKIERPDTAGNGEVLIFGRNIFMGYLGKEKETMAVFDEEGWFRTGDYGHMDDEDNLYVEGRKRDLISLNERGQTRLVHSVRIEEDVAKTSPLISDCMLIGDGRPHIAMLVTLKECFDQTGHPTGKLLPKVTEFLEEKGSSSRTVAEAREDPLVRAEVQSGISRYSQEQSKSYLRNIRWEILDRDFSTAEGLLRMSISPTRRQKMRPVIKEEFKDVISSLYLPS